MEIIACIYKACSTVVRSTEFIIGSISRPFLNTLVNNKQGGLINFLEE